MRYGDIAAPEDLRAGPLPEPRGPLTHWLFELLTGTPARATPAPPRAQDDPLYGDDSALALHCLYELHYRGFAGVDEAWEWNPALLATRQDLEAAFEHRVRAELPDPGHHQIPRRLYEICDPAEPGPSLSAYLATDGTVEQMREFAVHRSAYQLKEADPHTWAMPRLSGPAKAALVEIQFDEYGSGRTRDMHQNLFALTLAALGLDAGYHAYLDNLPGVTLATTNLVSFFGLHRRWRGALVGHLAVFEMTSVEPMGRYSAALRRFGYDAAARHFYDVHVVADAHHRTVAAEHLAAALVEAEPALAADVVFGAQALTAVEGAFTAHLLRCWKSGRTSLRPEQPAIPALRLAS